ncbi:putative Inner membrane ABC transporter ATP-binding protein YddA [Hyphomicrobiales bacterium]|nr:putative Inner membrane ABC transporter ATP-binding protein YddA [Hyphomicrobiales bacterium]CAH1701059.1 putative Inner membrane ABC transporter ATP-binding protein YddA [Hyphomicrobiales bacterium]CAI0344118.1 vitamin B12/bleomycin/antimicrobial peptide transport system ATP-binding/permease protein [Hyphomicrobiales bacterium]
MMTVLRHIARLTRLCIKGPGGLLGVLQFLVVVALGLIGVRVNVQLITWNADFYNAIQKLDVSAVLQQIQVYFGLTAISVVLHLASAYLRRMLQIRWRHSLTEAALERWLSGKAYWHLRDRTEAGLDNPDQRIAEDCRIFVDKLTDEALDLIARVVGLVSYVAILWSLSTFPLAFVMAGFSVEIPRYMVWAAPIYVAIATFVTHGLGAPLKKLDFEQQRREADFRFALTRLRENVEPVALAGGEAAERSQLSRRFAALAGNWRALANRELILGFFSRPYFQTVLTIPIFLALPAYLAGRVTFGGLMQLRSAFQNVVTTLSWFIFSYKDLAQLAATASRLSHFLAAAEAVSRTDRASGPEVSEGNRFRANGLALATPDGCALTPLPELELKAGETCWISAPSGFGKSTLVKALAGLWRHGEGSIERPAASVSFASQQVYLPLGSMAAALAYPALPEAFGEAQYREALDAVGLSDFWTSDEPEWQRIRHGLSGGERQRLALARLHLHKPDWLVLDEATSALDAEAEARTLSALRQALPNATFVLIAHREPQGVVLSRRIELRPQPGADSEGEIAGSVSEPVG